MGLGGPPKEKRTQLFFRDDGKFVFRRMEIDDTFLTEKRDGEIVNGWQMPYKGQFPFAGLGKKIPADQVTLSYARDIILDPYNMMGAVKKESKPVKGEAIAQSDWCREIGEHQRYKVQNKPSSMLMVDKITMILGGATLLIALTIAVRAVWLK